MNDNSSEKDIVLHQLQLQLQQHFLEQAVALTSEDMERLEQMVLTELPSYIQTGIYEVIQVFMDEKEPINQ